MKVNDLKKAMNTLKKVSAKNTIAILNNVLFENGKIIATNLEQFILFDTDIKENFLIDSGTLQKIASKIKAGNITFEVGERIHLLIDGVKKFSFTNNLCIDDFEKIPSGLNKKLIVSQDTYKTMHRASKHCSKDDLRPVMQSVLVSEHIVGTDAHRLLYVKNPNVPEFNILVPKEVFSLIDVKDELIDFNYSDKHCAFKFNEYELISRQTEGNFPSYISVIPTSFNGSLKFKKSDIIEDVELALIAANDYTKQIIIDASDKLVLMAKNIDFDDEFKTDIKGSISGESIRIGLNGEFFKQCLNELGDDIEFSYIGAMRGVVLNDQILLMPMAIIE